jgi:hypothetical protein
LWLVRFRHIVRFSFLKETDMPCAVTLEMPRTPAGRFAPGHSGNPAGRSKGARNHATLVAEALLEENAAELTRKLVDDGLAGDGRALRFLVGRLYPAARDRPITLDVAPGKETDPVHLHSVVIRAMADGEITPQEALAVARVIAVGAKLMQRRQRLGKERRSVAPVSDLHCEREADGARAAKSPSPACGGGTGRGQVAAAHEGSKRPHPTSPPQAGEGESEPVFSAVTVRPTKTPVSDRYFSRSGLRASTALGRPALLFPPADSCRAGSTERAAA